MKKTIEASKAVASNLEGSGAGAFPWASILELVMTMLGGNCFAQKGSLKQYAQDIEDPNDMGVVKKLAALIVIRRELGIKRSEAVKVRDEMFSAIAEMEPEDLDDIQQEVVSEVLPPSFII